MFALKGLFTFSAKGVEKPRAEHAQCGNRHSAVEKHDWQNYQRRSALEEVQDVTTTLGFGSVKEEEAEQQQEDVGEDAQRR